MPLTVTVPGTLGKCCCNYSLPEAFKSVPRSNQGSTSAPPTPVTLGVTACPNLRFLSAVNYSGTVNINTLSPVLKVVGRIGILFFPVTGLPRKGNHRNRHDFLKVGLGTEGMLNGHTSPERYSPVEKNTEHSEESRGLFENTPELGF